MFFLCVCTTIKILVEKTFLLMVQYCNEYLISTYSSPTHFSWALSMCVSLLINMLKKYFEELHAEWGADTIFS